MGDNFVRTTVLTKVDHVLNNITTKERQSKERRGSRWVIATVTLGIIILILVLWIFVLPQVISPKSSSGKPNTREVQNGVRHSISREGAVRDARCSNVSSTVWSCTVRL